MQPMPHIPGFELLTRLGGGPMTEVFAARDTASDTPCAVKTLRPDWEDEATAVKLLQREARAALGVRHPRLVRLVAAHVTCPPWFLVLELLPGESLRQRLRRDYLLPTADAVRIARQTAEALAALHRDGFVHGDVKPDNLQRSPDGDVTLLDLGFAHRVGENAAFLREGYVLGTASYLAPELCAPEPTEELGSDLFSLGVTLFELLTGQLPYPPGSVSQTVRRHCDAPPDDVREHVPEVPAALAVLVGRLLARRPEERPRAAAVVPQLIRLEIAALRRAG
jgi:serine/threonine protein kinase